MRGWYDIKHIDGIIRNGDVTGLEASDCVNGIVVSQITQGIENHSIVLMEFPKVASLLD